MNQLDIKKLQKDFRIYFPIEELEVYIKDSDLNKGALLDLDRRLSMFGLPLSKIPDRIIYRNRYEKPGYPADQTISLFQLKRLNPNVGFDKLERLYEQNMLLKFLWVEHFIPDDLSWRRLLFLCNELVDRSATEDDVFVRFSVMEPGTLELITS